MPENIDLSEKIFYPSKLEFFLVILLTNGIPLFALISFIIYQHNVILQFIPLLIFILLFGAIDFVFWTRWRGVFVKVSHEKLFWRNSWKSEVKEISLSEVADISQYGLDETAFLAITDKQGTRYNLPQSILSQRKKLISLVKEKTNATGKYPGTIYIVVMAVILIIVFLIFFFTVSLSTINNDKGCINGRQYIGDESGDFNAPLYKDC